MDVSTSLAQLFDVLEGEDKVLVVGDLNCRIGPCNNDLSEEENINDLFYRRRSSLDVVRNSRGRALLSRIADEGMIVLNGRSRSDPKGEFTFIRSIDSKSVIDLAFCSLPLYNVIDDFSITNALCNSDHVPIMITIDVESKITGIPDKRCIKWKPKATTEYNAILKEFLSIEQDLTPSAHSDYIRSAMVTAADDLGMTKTIRSNSLPPWFNADCRAKKALLRAAYRRRRRRGFDNFSLLELVEARHEYFSTVKIAEEQYYQRILSNVANSSSPAELWFALRRINNVKTNSSSELTAECVTRHFESLFNKFPRSELIPLPSLPYVPTLDDSISLLELESAISSLKQNKAPGPDGLGNEFYRAMDSTNRESLLALFNKILAESTCPASWGEIRITLIHKKGSATDPANFRGISLMNSITKLFTAIITARLALWAHINDVIPEIQSGFRAHRGCTDNIFVLSHLIEKKTSPPGGKLFTAFIDYKQAFDGVNHDLLWQKLSHMGVSPRLIRTIRSFYSVANARVALPQGDTNPIPIRNGVLQGDTLSPLLFSLFISDIELFIRSKYPHIEGVGLTHSHSILGLLYADDLVLFGRSRVHLNSTLSAVSDYSVQNDLVINTSKSKVMVFRKGGILAKGPRFLLGNEELEVVNKYQYLGVWFSSYGSFTGHVADTLCKAERAGAALRTLLVRVGQYSSEMANTLTAAKVTSTLLHASEIWGLDHHESLQLPIIRFYKKLFHLPASTPHNVIKQEFSIPCLKAIIDRRAVTWLAKVASMSPERLPRICLQDQFDRLLRNPAQQSWLSRLNGRLLDANIELDLIDWPNAPFDRIKKTLFDFEYRAEAEFSFTRAIESSHCPMYRCLSRRSQFITNESISTLRLLLQVQLTNDRYPRLLWSGTRTLFYPHALCPLCNRGSPDSLAHFILDCPVLAAYRPPSIKLLAAHQGPEHARLAAVLNKRSAHLDLVTFLSAAITARSLAN